MKCYWLCIYLFLASNVTAQTATPEVSNPKFGDIAGVFSHAGSPTGAVIVYNPIICQNIGAAACEFFRVHEHGHVYFGHIFQPFAHPMGRERDADRFAAANAHPQAVLEAWHLFRNGGSSSNWHTYGTPLQRARRLCIFAQEAGNWIGPPHC